MLPMQPCSESRGVISVGQAQPHRKQLLALSSFTSSFIGTLACAGEHAEEEANTLALLFAFNFGEGYKGPETQWANLSFASMSQITKGPIPKPFPLHPAAETNPSSQAV